MRDERRWRMANPFGNSTSDSLTNDTTSLFDALGYGLETAAFAQFHDDLDLAGGGRHVGTAEGDQILMDGRARAEEEVELAEELIRRRASRGNSLPGYDLAIAPVLDLVDGAANLAEKGDFLEIGIGVGETRNVWRRGFEVCVRN